MELTIKPIKVIMAVFTMLIAGHLAKLFWLVRFAIILATLFFGYTIQKSITKKETQNDVLGIFVFTILFTLTFQALIVSILWILKQKITMTNIEISVVILCIITMYFTKKKH